MSLTTRYLTRGTVVALTLSWAFAVHADPRVADEKIAVAQAAVQRAEQSEAPQLAPVDLETARSKLSRAQKAQMDHNSKVAADLADQANVDAEVAEASARAQHSHAAAAEFDASMQALRAEAMRRSQSTTGQ